MRLCLTSTTVLLWLAAASASAQVNATVVTPPGAKAETADSPRLPIRRVALYKNGIGYFEHLGQVRGRQEVRISFTSGQLNDVLKSLTVLDLDGGRIAGVGYGVRDLLERQLGEDAFLSPKTNSLTEFLSALRGARIEVRSGAGPALTGRLLSVERKTRISGGTTLEVDYIALLTDAGELRTTEVSPSFSVRLLERDLPRRMGRYLDTVSQEREPDARDMTIATDGTGARDLFVSYISEVPVWKSTYRVVFDDKAGRKPLLQGWAIVDNTVGQDWEDVELSLVAGAPQSFIQSLSRPIYARRPVVDVAAATNYAPQTYEATLRTGRAVLQGVVRDPNGAAIFGAMVKAYGAGNQLVGETRTQSDGRYEFTSLPEGEIRLEFLAPGFQTEVQPGVMVALGRPQHKDAVLSVGNIAQAIEVSASPSQLQTSSASRARLRPSAPASPQSPGSGNLTQAVGQALSSSVAGASAHELGDLFEYKLKERITIRKNQSALVPIVQTPIDAEKVTIWNDSSTSPRPMRGLWLTNSSGLTLDGGAFTVLDQNAFAGEGLVETLRAGEKRLISFATDLALNANSRTSTEKQRVSRVRIGGGILTHEQEIRESKTYTFRNEDTKPRTVIVEHPVRTGYSLRSEPKPEEQTAQWMRFRFPVGAKETRSLVVEEVRMLPATYSISDLEDKTIAVFVGQKTITPEMEKALRGVLARRNATRELEVRSAALEEERERIREDQNRIRENMKALRGSPEEKSLLLRYTQQLNAQEDRLQTLETEIRKAEDAAEQARQELSRYIESLIFEASL
jgi:hypothetical protein